MDEICAPLPEVVILEFLMTTLSKERRDTPPFAVKLTFSTFNESNEPIPNSYPEKEMSVDDAISILFADIIMGVDSEVPELKTTLPGAKVFQTQQSNSHK